MWTDYGYMNATQPAKRDSNLVGYYYYPWQPWANCTFPAGSTVAAACAGRVATATSLAQMRVEYNYGYRKGYYTWYPNVCSEYRGCYGDCCADEASYVLYIILPSLALTWTIGQLFTPVLGSILLMMCVIDVHTLHVTPQYSFAAGQQIQWYFHC